MNLAIRVVLVVVLAAAGVFAVLGFGLALLFEVDGFGVPAGSGPRTGHRLGYGFGVFLGVAVPAAGAWLLLPRGRRWVVVVAVAALALAAIGVLGIMA